MTGTKAVGADTAAKTVTLDNGDTVTYEKLLIATGSSPKTLDVPGADGPNVHLLRTWDDSDSLKAHLGRKIILVGGGYIGVEVAADFLQKAGRRPLLSRPITCGASSPPPQYGAFLKKKLEAAGAEIILGDEVTEITLTGVKTKAGRTLTATWFWSASASSPI